MKSESDKGSEGRGLPVGWGWRPRTGNFAGGVIDLYPPDADVGEERATVYPSGKWETWEEDRIAERLNKGTATPRPGETRRAAAQREAEAALWRVDGYGTGEVRGRFVAHGQGFGLPGRWRTKALRTVPGGHEVDAVREGVEVDAVRAPVAEPAPCIECAGSPWPTCLACGKGYTIDDWAAALPEPAPLPLAAMTGCDSHSVEPRAGCAECEALAEREEPSFRTGCAEHLRIWGRGCETCDRLRAGGEPAPRETVPFPTDSEASVHRDVMRTQRAFALRRATPPAPTLDATAEIITDPTAIDCGCSGGCGRMPDEMVFTGKVGSALLCIHCYTRAVREDERRRAVKAEPPAPTDGAELARLLPGLLDYCAAVLAEPDEDTRSRLGVGKHLALACSLLLGERERVAATLQALFSDVATPIELATHTTELLEEAARETDKLRARVAELEEANARLQGMNDTQAQTIDTMQTLLSAPPPHTVAALLAKVEEARDTARDKRGDHDGESPMAYRYEGMRDAFDIAAGMVRATLGAPTPLDRAVGEVCAVPPFAGTLAESFDRIGEALDLVGDESTPEGTRRALAKVARVALAGMLACDAPATKEPG